MIDPQTLSWGFPPLFPSSNAWEDMYRIHQRDLPKAWNWDTSSYISKLSSLSRSVKEFVLNLPIVNDKGNLLKDLLWRNGLEFLVELRDYAPIDFDVPEVLNWFPRYEKGKGFNERVFIIKLVLMYRPKDIADFLREYEEIEFSSVWTKCRHKYFSKFIHKELLKVFMK